MSFSRPDKEFKIFQFPRDQIPRIDGDFSVWDMVPVSELYFRAHGNHAQNYHIFTPARNKDWAMIWGNTPWIKEFPYANAAYDYDFLLVIQLFLRIFHSESDCFLH